MDLSVVVGNPKRQSRTLTIANSLADRVCRAIGAEHKVTIDLAEHAHLLFEWPCAPIEALNLAVQTSDFVIVASPTYKASYTGLLKAFLDRYAHDGLGGVTAIPVMTASAPEHALAVEFTLRPLLVELGASVPTRGMYFSMTNMARMDGILDEWYEANLSGIKPAPYGNSLASQ
jgi:FMN reductase